MSWTLFLQIVGLMLIGYILTYSTISATIKLKDGRK